MEYTSTEDAQQTVTIAAEAVADPVVDELAAQVQKFKDEGRIPTTEGEYMKLDDFSQTFSQLGSYQAYPLGIELENFVFSGHLKWSTATETSDLVVYQTHAYVYVDGAFIGEYTLSQDKPLKGSFGYGIISGTNKDYGTRCEITNAGVWSLK